MPFVGGIPHALAMLGQFLSFSKPPQESTHATPFDRVGLKTARRQSRKRQHSSQHAALEPLFGVFRYR